MAKARNLGSTGDPSGRPGSQSQPGSQSSPGQPGEPSELADSAGQPWAGRGFEANLDAGDDGSAPAALAEALTRFQAREAGEESVIDAIRGSRLLIPLVTKLGEAALNARGQTIDKTQELSIITVAGPDGRTVLPAFSSTAAMTAWNPLARPVPADAVRVALAAAQENTDLVVLDPTSPGEFVIRRPALWAIAQSLPWTPSYASHHVADAFAASIATELSVLTVQLSAGDPLGRLEGPELVVQLELVDGLTQPDLDTILSRLGTRWSESEVITTGVDSLRVKLIASA
ncbi:SseB protein N-terminal domain-containing protein [Cryobacterium flavum]|uniref:SseB family protein n=1 Tax=Cryobacterium flavum TaxID=1424659 RepID=A0A4R8V3S7_9MICO|nr:MULTISPECIES: SseB family protein [Cryobacterium]TFB75720.1 SseB family protein [Cryobacterium flavum]SDN82588.1 SseB protein N-terminal domain-containing protein [Cryobacterium flavum]